MKTCDIASALAVGLIHFTSCLAQSCNVIPDGNQTWDYIVVGAGPGGIPMADKLSEGGKSVLLVEKGPKSLGRFDPNGTFYKKPGWLEGSNLSRFDVPGLANQIYTDAARIVCNDTELRAGCLLGGGATINAGLWWKPNPADWDENFPDGWKSQDLVAATERVFERIPGTAFPSTDGVLYRREWYDAVSSFITTRGWKEVKANEVPDEKNHTVGHSEFMYFNGERGGVMATYLVSALSRPQNVFSLWTDTSVEKIIRDGGRASAVQLRCTSDYGVSGLANLTPETGRIVISAGAFGTPKLLFRSGIGPADQLKIVQASPEGQTMISETSWINLPVGKNLADHLNTQVTFLHPAAGLAYYDFGKAFNSPVPSDASAYLENRTGILTQAAPNIGPMLWDEVTPSDGIVRALEWTARVQGSDSALTAEQKLMAATMSQYLGRGAQSRGRVTINETLQMVVSEQPFLHNAADREAVIMGIDNMRASLSGMPNLTWFSPAPNQTTAEYVDSMNVTASERTSQHWIGTAKMGIDDGTKGGSSVVDLDGKVFGTENIFVADASIIPGPPSVNPQAMIAIASEQLAARILALG